MPINGVFLGHFRDQPVNKLGALGLWHAVDREGVRSDIKCQFTVDRVRPDRAPKLIVPLGKGFLFCEFGINPCA